MGDVVLVAENRVGCYLSAYVSEKRNSGSCSFASNHGWIAGSGFLAVDAPTPDSIYHFNH